MGCDAGAAQVSAPVLAPSKVLTPIQLVVVAILDNAHAFKWSVQGLGLLRLYIRDMGRLHIWTSRLSYGPHVSTIHDHSWNLRSEVVLGKLRNTKFMELPIEDHRGTPYWKHRIVTGYGARPVTTPEQVRLHGYPTHTYEPGDQYMQAAAEIHRTTYDDGTVTLMRRAADKDGEAHVFWPVGEQWGSATPRPATYEDIEIAVASVRRFL